MFVHYTYPTRALKQLALQRALSTVFLVGCSVQYLHCCSIVLHYVIEDMRMVANKERDISSEILDKTRKKVKRLLKRTLALRKYLFIGTAALAIVLILGALWPWYLLQGGYIFPVGLIIWTIDNIIVLKKATRENPKKTTTSTKTGGWCWHTTQIKMEKSNPTSSIINPEGSRDTENIINTLPRHTPDLNNNPPSL